MAEEFEREPEDKETTTIDGVVYDCKILESYAENIGTEEIDINLLVWNLEEGHYYWDDAQGEKLGPSQILQDWEGAQKNEAWRSHVDNIKQANVDNPIWVTQDYFCFNGIHRLTKTFLEKKKTIKVKVFDKLPEDAIIK